MPLIEVPGNTGLLLEFEVAGSPAPQGSKSYVGHRAGRPVLVESSKAVRPWRGAVHAAGLASARQAGWQPATGPVRVTLDFFVRRPKSGAKDRRWCDRRPDLDKLVRSTLDALTTCGVIEDDARVAELVTRKMYSDKQTGVRVLVELLYLG